MTWLAAMSLYWLARKEGVKNTIAALLAGSILFQPLFFFFGYTFLTDVTGCLWMILVVMTIRLPVVRMSLSSTSGKQREIHSLLAIGLLATVVSTGYLVRQTAIIPAIAIAMLLVPAIAHRRIHIFHALLGVVLVIVPVIAFWVWIEQFHGVPINYQKPFLQLDLLTQPKILIAKTLLIVSALGLYLAPISVYAMLVQPRQTSDRSSGPKAGPLPRFAAVAKRFAIACSAGFLGATAFWFFPPLRTIRPLFGIHPHDLDLGNLPTVVGLREHLYSPVWFAIGGQSVTRWDFFTLPIACTAISICLWLLWRSRAEIRQSCSRTLRGHWPASWQIFATSLVGQFILLLLVRDVFDRYLMPLYLLALPLFFPLLHRAIPAVTSGENNSVVASPRLARAATVMLVLSLGVVGVSSVVWTHDRRLEWQIAWETGEQLREDANPSDWLHLGLPYYGDKIYRPAIEEQLAAHDYRLKSIPRGRRERLLQQYPEIGYVLVVQGQETSLPDHATKLRTLTIPTWCKPAKWDLYDIRNAPPE